MDNLVSCNLSVVMASGNSNVPDTISNTNLNSFNKLPSDCKSAVVAFLNNTGLLAFRALCKETRGLSEDRFVSIKAPKKLKGLIKTVKLIMKM